jgi:hypothetical protein
MKLILPLVQGGHVMAVNQSNVLVFAMFPHFANKTSCCKKSRKIANGFLEIIFREFKSLWLH